jgi:formylglycine-generating enzyme required for sulfatase activity
VREGGLSSLDALTGLRTLALDGMGIWDFNGDGRITGLEVLQDPGSGKPDPAYRAGESFRECPECPRMVIVPGGTFVVGSPAREPGRGEDEGPQQSVPIRHAFAVGEFEVRFDEWMHCVRDGGECPMVSDESWGRGARPVVNISWNHAKRYVDWLSKKTGEQYRLLTEAEWEYAARAGSTTSRYWGNADNEACLYANVADRTAKKTYKTWTVFDCDDGYAESAPVGAFQPNAFGLHDTLGNVSEWVEDCYASSYGEQRTDGSALLKTDCPNHVVRGGGWDGVLRSIRSANRGRVGQDIRDRVLGFRVARTLTP